MKLLLLLALVFVSTALSPGMAGQDRIPLPKNIVPGKVLVVEGDSAYTLGVKGETVFLLRVQNKVVEEVPIPFQGLPLILKSNPETISQQKCLDRYPFIAGILPKSPKASVTPGIFCLEASKNWKKIAETRTEHLRTFITAHEIFKDQKPFTRFVGVVKPPNQKAKRITFTWDSTSKEILEESLVVDQVLRESSIAYDSSTFFGISESYQLVSCSLTDKRFDCEQVKDAPTSVGSISKVGSTFLLGTLSSMNTKSKKSLSGELSKVTFEKPKTGGLTLTKRNTLRAAQSILAIETHPIPKLIHYIDFESFTQSALDAVKLPN